MAIKKKVENIDLNVTPGSDVILTISIGNAQIGASVVRFKESNGVLAKGEIKKIPLGNGSDLSGKTLKVTTNILDSNTQSNGVVVTYFFESCNPKVVMFDDNVDQHGDIVSFLGEFNFR